MDINRNRRTTLVFLAEPWSFKICSIQKKGLKSHLTDSRSLYSCKLWISQFIKMHESAYLSSVNQVSTLEPKDFKPAVWFTYVFYVCM